MESQTYPVLSKTSLHMHDSLISVLLILKAASFTLLIDHAPRLSCFKLKQVSVVVIPKEELVGSSKAVQTFFWHD